MSMPFITAPDCIYMQGVSDSRRFRATQILNLALARGQSN